MAQKPAGPIVQWKYNEGAPAPPPADAREWEAIVQHEVGGAGVLVEFVSHENGSWWISKADRIEAQVSGTYKTSPTDLREQVKAALRGKGKPVID